MSPEVPAELGRIWLSVRLDAAIPSPPTSLIGREQEISRITTLIREDDERLVSLIGPGGVGKTRLALAIAHACCTAFEDVCFVSLDAATETGDVERALLLALGLRVDRVGAIDQIATWFQRRSLLLVLDNFEQIVDAAPFVSELIARCPQFKIIVTSRMPLRLYGERIVQVQPLPLPPPAGAHPLAEVEQTPAVRLFVARAKAADPEFALSQANSSAVVALCRRLDGLPLAIELAAAQISMLSPAMILDRINRRVLLPAGGPIDVPPRLQSLRAAIGWSYDMLAPSDQALLRYLSVFAGGFTVASACALWTAVTATRQEPTAEEQILRGITSLMRQSLIFRRKDGDEEPRFALLETIRDFATECLEVSGEAEAVRNAFSTYFGQHWSGLPRWAMVVD